MNQQPASPLDKLPPYDIDAEEGVIASCLVDDAAIAAAAVIVRPADFFQEKNGIIFDAMLELDKRQQPVSPIPVAHELGERGMLDAVGGLAYLMQLTTDLPTARHADFYASIVAQQATFRRLVSAGGRIAQLGYNGGSDLDGTLVQAYEALRAAEGRETERDWVTVAQLTERFAPAFLDRLQSPERTRGVPTRLRALDRLLSNNGLLPGKLYVAGGYTSMGKSTFLRIVLRNIAMSGEHVALVTPEQDEEEVWEELLYGLADFDHSFHEVTGAELTETEERRMMDALGRMAEMGTFHVSAVVEPSPSEIRLRLMRLRSRCELRVAGIDYLHILKPDSHRNSDTEATELTRMVKSIRDMAKELGVATILMAQLNRASQDHGREGSEFRPIMTDFHGSSTIEKVAYAVIGLHRRGYYVPDRLEAKPELDDILEAIILKQQRGPRGTARLRFAGALSQVSDLPEWS